MSSRKATDWFAVTGRLLLAVAAGVSLYLASMVFGRTALPGCEENSVCQEMLQSHWAYTFGIPVSFLGCLLYSYTIMLSWSFVRRDRSLSGLAGGMATSTIVAAALWFTALQIFDLGANCMWCNVIHGSAVAGAFLLWHSRLSNPPPDLDCSVDLRDASSPLSNDRVFRFTATGAALTGVGMLALGSLSGPLGPRRPGNAAAPDSPRPATVVLLNGWRMPANFFPSLGSVAPGVPTAVLLSDYTAEPCRAWLQSVEDAAANITPPVRIVVVPAWRSQAARDIQRTMMTVYQHLPAAFYQLSKSIASGEVRPDPDSVGNAARALIGKSQYSSTALNNALAVEHRISVAEKLCSEATRSADNLPLLVMDDRTLRGPAPSRDEIVAFLKGEEVPYTPRIPALSVEESPELDDMAPGGSREIQITIRNTGDGPLRLEKADPAEGCEVISLPVEPVAPGTTAAIGLKVTAPGTAGTFVRQLQLPSNAPGAPVTVTVRGRTVSAMASTSPSGTE